MGVLRGAMRTLARYLRYLRGGPLTLIWLSILLVTTVFQHLLTPQRLDKVLGHRSTNLHHLAHDPLHVLFVSLFWVDGSFWFPYAVMFALMLVPAERWLGSLRWLGVGAAAHVIATYVSEGVLGLGIYFGDADAALVDVRDVGVSYFLAGIAGVLTYHQARPWRWVYLVGAFALLGLPVITDPSFTALGHLMSLLVGLACYPMVRGRAAPPWDPLVTMRRATKCARGIRKRAPT